MITFIRHAKQKSKLVHDSSIIPFTPFNVNVDLIIVSPYLRCRQTAEYFNKPIQVDTRLSEFQSYKNIKLDNSSLNYGEIPIKETWKCFTDRIDSVYEDISNLHCNVLVITHGIVVKYLEEKIKGTIKYKRGRDVPYLKGFTV